MSQFRKWFFLFLLITQTEVVFALPITGTFTKSCPAICIGEATITPSMLGKTIVIRCTQPPSVPLPSPCPSTAGIWTNVTLTEYP